MCFDGSLRRWDRGVTKSNDLVVWRYAQIREMGKSRPGIWFTGEANYAYVNGAVDIDSRLRVESHDFRPDCMNNKATKVAEAAEATE